MNFVIRCKAKDLQDELERLFPEDIPKFEELVDKSKRYYIEIRPYIWHSEIPEPDDYETDFDTFELAFNIAIRDHVFPAISKDWKVTFEQPKLWTKNDEKVLSVDKAAFDKPYVELVRWEIVCGTSDHDDKYRLYEVVVGEHVCGLVTWSECVQRTHKDIVGSDS